MSAEPVTWWDEDVLDRDRWGAFVEPALERLIRARNRDRLPHAVLLVGPAGLGRELAAVEAAVLLVCAGADDPWRDGACANRVRGGVHPDVQAVLPTGAKRIITIAQIREIVKSAARPAIRGRDGACGSSTESKQGHLGAAAANAFLKVLEEPPAHVVFIPAGGQSDGGSADHPSPVANSSLCREIWPLAHGSWRMTLDLPELGWAFSARAEGLG